MPPSSITAESLTTALMESHACDSVEEAAAIAHAILQDVVDKLHDSDDELEMNIIIVESLQEYFGWEPDEARVILRKAGANDGDDDDHSETSSEEDAIQDHTDTDSDNDGDMIGEGECELCERQVQLTKHHLIPKSTHARIEPKLLHAVTAIQEGQEEKARVVLGPGLEHLLDALSVSLSDASTSNNRIIVKRHLSKTCDICRPCHSAVHNTHDNMVLALHYNTVEQLLNDEAIYKFCQWAHKQKAGKYALRK